MPLPVAPRAGAGGGTGPAGGGAAARRAAVLEHARRRLLPGRAVARRRRRPAKVGGTEQGRRPGRLVLPGHDLLATAAAGRGPRLVQEGGGLAGDAPAAVGRMVPRRRGGGRPAGRTRPAATRRGPTRGEEVTPFSNLIRRGFGPVASGRGGR